MNGPSLRSPLSVAAATLAPSTLSLIRNMFQDAQRRTIAVGIWATSFLAGTAVGPLLGGLIRATPHQLLHGLYDSS